MQPETLTQPTRRATTAKQRDISIDTLRGLAIILMVAGHVIGSTSEFGMKVAEDSTWRYYYELFSDLRMPLFTALSGYVYAIRPLRDPDRFGRFVWGKTRRLIIPLLTVGTAFVILQTLTPGTNAEAGVGDTWRLYVYGSGHFWFLQAIFLIFLIVGILDAFGVFRTPARVCVGIAAASVVYVAVQVPNDWNVFSINGAIRLLPFFLLGYLIRLYWKRGAARWWLLAATVVFFMARAFEVFGAYALDRPASAALSVALGISGISTLMLFRDKLAWRPLARLGYFSYAIYLLHVFGTAPTRMLLNRAGIESESLVFIVCLLAGLVLPVLFETTLGRVRWISWAFLGQKPYRGIPR